MDEEEEKLFLATAYRFLSEISYGGPSQSLRYPVPGSGIPISASTPREDGLKIVDSREWIQDVTNAPFIKTRVGMLCSKGSNPMCYLSLHGYLPPTIRKLKGRPEGDDISEDILRPQNRKVQSYQHLLLHANGQNGNDDEGEEGGNEEEEREKYNPNFLDDPELRTGKHRTGSINHFTKADFLKRELNEKFRKLHPNVHPTLTLSQLRNLKTRLLTIALSCGLELATVAQSYTYLEKLILLRAVNKRNRRVIGGCCLILASKATDTKNVDYGVLLDKLAAELPVGRRELVEMEFPVLSGLHFRLQIPEEEYGGHLERILTQLDYSNLQEYLGERMHESWQMNM